MSALVLIELNGSEVSANSRAAITAASQLADTIDALVLTNAVDNASQTSSLEGLGSVKVIVNEELEHACVEVASGLIAEEMASYKYLVAGSST